jgi:hypothetical protein|tara:strand:- start:2275 stop:2511 length:237 start_codon:yes stop_codon:yes gene_type:complete
MSKQKRKKPKRWYEENINSLIQNYNIIAGRLYSLETAFGMYVDMRKNKAKLEKFIEKKIKDSESKKDKESTAQTVRDA